MTKAKANGVPSIDEVVTATAKHFAIPEHVLRDTAFRTQKVTYARHMSMYLSRRLTYRSFHQVAETFNQDHTTVLYGFNRIAKAQQADPAVKKDVEALTKLLK